MGLPHALIHARELVERGGHHAAFCTSIVEASHKHIIKMAARYARTFANLNKTQEHMLTWCLRQNLWDAVHLLHLLQEQEREKRERDKQERDTQQHDATLADESASPAPANTAKKSSPYILRTPLNYTNAWSDVVFDRAGRTTPPQWKYDFLSRKVLVTREELLCCVLVKLNMSKTTRNLVSVFNSLHFHCYGAVTIKSTCGTQRTIVGTNSSNRRDFMRLRGTFTVGQPRTGQTRTSLSVQVIMFVKICGFSEEGIILPRFLRNPLTNKNDVILALVRWLSPHPTTVLRDSEKRPVCPGPFDTNHSLWKFTELDQRRPAFTPARLSDKLHMFNGCDDNARKGHAETFSKAQYDLVRVESLDYFMNCTYIDDDANTILETNTLPFD